VIRCDLMILDDSGNLQDACLIAIVAALRSLKIPEHELASDEADGSDAASPAAGASTSTAEVKVRLTGGEPVPFEVERVPLSCTFAVLDKHLLADPTFKEEEVCDGQVTVARLADSVSIRCLCPRCCFARRSLVCHTPG